MEAIMKKTLAILLTLSILMLTLCSCGEEIAEQYEISNYDGVSEVSTNSDGKFLVKDKKYDYDENDFVILDVTNTSETDCGVKITMTYFDESGKELGKEDKSFGSFSKGYQNYFCFAPEYAFETYSYNLEISEYTGQHYEDKVEVKALQLSEAKMVFNTAYPPDEVDGDNFIDFRKYPSITFSYTYSNTSTERLSVPVTFVIFNEKNEVIKLIDRTATIEPKWKIGDDYDSFILYITSQDELTWPEKYKGEIKTIVCVRDITVEG